MNRFLRISHFALLLGSTVISCSKQELEDINTSTTQASDGRVAPTLASPTITFVSATGSSITLNICAGSTGAPAGFSVQWMLASEYAANGNTWPISSEVVASSSFCKASFSGVPGASDFNLPAGQCAVVTIGDVLFDQVGASSPCENVPLTCGKAYVFRAFAHNVPQGLAKSNWSGTVSGSTNACSVSGGCTYTQGYWKTHGSAGKASEKILDANGAVIGYKSVWPVTSLTLGTVTYTEAQIQAIFDQSGSGNGLIKLAHQLMAAKLNIANGAAPTAIASTIAATDALIGGLVIPPTNGSNASLSNSAVSAFNDALTSYNEGLTGPGHCPDEE